MVRLRDGVQGFCGDGLIRIGLEDLLKPMRGSKVGAPPVIELSHEEMHLRDPIMAFLEFLQRLAVIAATGELFSHLFECSDGLVHRFRITIDGLRHLDMNFPDPECCVWSQDVIAMELQEVFVLDQGLRILLFLEIGLSPLHDDVGVVVVLNGISEENLLVSAAEDLLDPASNVTCADIAGTRRDEQ